MGSWVRFHQCPKGSKSPLVLFCSESMPKACNICKFLFTSEKYLVEHVTKVHTSVVSTKACTFTTPSLVNGKDNRRAQSTKVQLQSAKFVSKAINGTHSDGQTSGTNGALAQPNQLPSSHLHAPFAVLSSPPDTNQEGALSNPPSQPMPTILAMFENDSHRLALMKRMNTSWRSKVPYPCRQCGAVLRQPSLIISHRYLHRGRRSHQCPCGRAFKHRLHLLRHCVQHAEAISYICVSCGDTFTGAKLLAQHLKGRSLKKSPSGCTWKRKVKRTCRMTFMCDCGELFLRPSAYIWHQLKNRTASNKSKKPTM
uniref:C2H2-type domain-containing protein n=1 Tax=Oreochromis niloticus TaxID=8128 RepID=A0A669EJ12_ORENI